MSYLYITGLLGMKIDSKLKSPMKIGKDLYITNNPAHFSRKIKSKQASAIGSLETNYLLSRNPVLFSEKPTKNIDESHVDIVNFMRDCLAFLSSLWMEEDNSVNIELGFAISQKKYHVHSNSLSYHYWTCTGKKRDHSVSIVQLEAIYNKYGSCFGGMYTDVEPEHTMQRKEIGRINVGLNFLQQARSTPDLGLKIANYCSLFETLLSTSNTELSHQMSERAAFYLSDNPEGRLDHYKMSKQAYNVRSKVVHGDVVSKRDIPKLFDICAHCDACARLLIIKILEDKEYQAALNDKTNTMLDKFFVNKIFGIEPSSA